MPPPLPPPRHPQANQIEYRSPVMGSPRRPVVDVPLLCTGVLFIVVVSALTVFVAPRLEAVFRDFGTKLPGVSIGVLRFARFCNRGGLPVVWVLLLAPAFLVPLLRPWPPEDPRVRHSRLARTVVILLLSIFTAWVALGLFMPYVSLVESVSGGASKR
jgi:hypothetical protein